MKSKNIKKILLSKEGKIFALSDISKDFHCQFGLVKKSDLDKKPGSIVETNKGTPLTLLSPSFIDLYKKIKRGPQIIPRKDIGLILAETGIGKDSFVVDSGGGSGALSFMLAHHVKKVVSYEIREDFFNILEHNKEFLGLKNITLKNKSIYEGIDEKQVNVITLDLPEPWKVVDHAATSLKRGGFLVSYSPSIPQVMDFVSKVKENDSFVYLKTVEILVREWEVQMRKVRPKSSMMGHSGFLVFSRRI